MQKGLVTTNVYVDMDLKEGIVKTRAVVNQTPASIMVYVLMGKIHTNVNVVKDIKDPIVKRRFHLVTATLA